MEFKSRFNEILKLQKVKQIDIAKALNISKQCVNDYTTGKSKPSLDTLFELCKFLDVTSDYLLGLSDEY